MEVNQTSNDEPQPGGMSYLLSIGFPFIDVEKTSIIFTVSLQYHEIISVFIHE